MPSSSAMCPPGPPPSACPRECCRVDPSKDHDVGMSLEPMGPRGADIPRVLIVADHASARFGGEAALPLHYFRLLRARNAPVWLISHARTRDELQALFGDDARILYVEDTRLH